MSELVSDWVSTELVLRQYWVSTELVLRQYRSSGTGKQSLSDLKMATVSLPTFSTVLVRCQYCVSTVLVLTCFKISHYEIQRSCVAQYSQFAVIAIEFHEAYF